MEIKPSRYAVYQSIASFYSEFVDLAITKKHCVGKLVTTQSRICYLFVLVTFILGADGCVHRSVTKPVMRKVDQQLLTAARDNKDIKVRELLKAGANANVNEKHSLTPLLYASKRGHSAVVKTLVADGADINAKEKILGFTPLIAATNSRHSDVVNILLGAGANINAEDRDGRTALMWAALKGELEILKSLLDNSADISIIDHSGMNALMYASQSGHVKVVKALLNAGFSARTKNQFGWTALHSASFYGRSHVVKTLLSAGADINARDQSGWTALMAATYQGKVEVVTTLLDANAENNAKNQMGETAAQLALKNKDKGIIKALHNKGIDLTAKDIQVTEDLPAIGNEFKDCDSCPVMVVLPPGKFSMGSRLSHVAYSKYSVINSKPVHSVTIARSIAVSKYEITEQDWILCRDEGGCSNPPHDFYSRSNRSQYPVSVTWRQAVEYTQWLSAKTKHNYRLLSEAEWEYAVRAGSNTLYYWGDDPIYACQYENSMDSSFHCHDDAADLAVVGNYLPNPFGLHDMLGNLDEWVMDCWHADYIKAPSNGNVWLGGDCSLRVIRGGSFISGPLIMTSATRWKVESTSDRAFRIAMTSH